MITTKKTRETKNLLKRVRFIHCTRRPAEFSWLMACSAGKKLPRGTSIKPVSVRICVLVFVCVFGHVGACMCMFVCVCGCVHVRVTTRVCVYVCMCMCHNVCKCKCVLCVCVHMYVCMCVLGGWVCVYVCVKKTEVEINKG